VRSPARCRRKLRRERRLRVRLRTFVNDLGYAVNGVHSSADPALLAAASSVEQAASAGSCDAISDALPAFISACSGY
jgi:hypothetical protein